MAKISGTDLAKIAELIRKLADEVEAGNLGNSPSILRHNHCSNVMTPATGDMVTDLKYVGMTVVISSLPGLQAIEAALKQYDRSLPIEMGLYPNV